MTAHARRGSAPADGTVGWVGTRAVDGDGGAAAFSCCNCRCPGCWTRQSRRIDAQAQNRKLLARLLHEMGRPTGRDALIGGERLFQVLSEAAPTGVRDADPAYWMLRLETLRLANRAPD